VVYEAMNIASKWELPLLIVVEDNKYSQSTSQPETLAGTLEGRAAAFGIPFAKGDTWNWQGLAGEAGRMIERIRQDSRPGMLQIETFRLKAHSKGDDTRPREAIEPFEKMDPINLVLGELSAEEEPWVLGLKQRISEAIGKAEREPLAVLPDMRPATGPVTWSEARRTERQRVVVALNETLHQLMGEHEGIFLLGEDVLAPYGGAFKVTKGLSDAFPGRVKNTPISEGCITGMGVGLGLLPFYPIVEIMFGDFIGLAFDQIVNHAAKFKQMYNGQIDTNVIVRTPMGGGRGYGPTHSQTLDRHFLGVPGLRVLALNHLIHPGQLYRPLIVPGSGPTLVIENKLLYGEFIQSEAPEGYAVLHSSQTFPSVWVRPEAAKVDVTLLGYGGTSGILLEACDRLFEEHDLVAQVVCVMQVYPFDVTSILEALEGVDQLVIVEEGQGFAGFGAEVIAQIAELGTLPGLAVRRVTPPAFCIPSCGPLEKQVLPSAATIIEAALAMGKS